MAMRIEERWGRSLTKKPSSRTGRSRRVSLLFLTTWRTASQRQNYVLHDSFRTSKACLSPRLPRISSHAIPAFAKLPSAVEEDSVLQMSARFPPVLMEINALSPSANNEAWDYWSRATSDPGRADSADCTRLSPVINGNHSIFVY
ncbi:hypothetical protein ASPVEDRAFT_439524 [Aspergillus versicolor CBS 583.65]|uniref:Uncharacterized protein n=1 Tax=Aspergillus versicolor CBS 583.65 TaxID=1036611 RepID=A0A1L9P8V8_ASPVE|nr:uncharacterized protein ASPVEDRAFT_439524 [Aspergillus versicolor CBS 583.65]OJI97951.1 hypothetical protein ASPVEDRAFT_439524 [Aspergillus versicolor CBS 583.65]